MANRAAGWLALPIGLVALVASAPQVGAQTTPTFEQVTPTIAYNGGDSRDFLLAWVEDRGGGSDIYGKRLFENGLPKGGPDRGGYQLVRDSSGRSDPRPGPRSSPDLVYNSLRAEFLLVFSEMASELDGWDVFAVRLSSAGYSRGNARLVAGGPGDQQHPDVAVIGPDGDYIIAYDDNSRDIDEVWAVRVRSNGIPNGSPFPLQQGAANASDPTTNGEVVAWVDDRNGDTDIYAVRIRTNGLPEGTDYRLAATDDNDTNPNFGAGQLVWNVFDAATGLDIQGAQVYGNGLVRGGQQGILVPAADQGWPSTANGGLVVFSDNRTGEYDIYAVRLANGRSRGREFPLVRDIAFP
jgi:hypothetical protein